MSQKSSADATRPNYRMHNISIVGLLVVIVLLLLRSCLPTSTSPYRDAETKPGDIDQWACKGEGGELNCAADESGHALSLSNVPNGVTPYLVPISADKEAELSKLPMDGFTCLAIVGNLVFYDDKSEKLVTSFSTPVTLHINVTPGDLSKLADCQSDPKYPTIDELMPVYLFLPAADASVNIWKPFQTFKLDPERPGGVTVEFNYWSDDPFGFGSPKKS